MHEALPLGAPMSSESSTHRAPRDPDRALWLGRRLPDPRGPARLAVASGLGTAVLLLVGVAGIDVGPPAGIGLRHPDVVHLCVELTIGVLLVGAGAAWLARAALVREATPFVVGVHLVVAGLLAGLHGVLGGRGDSAVELAGPMWTWTASRGWLVLGMVVAPLLGGHRSPLGRRVLGLATWVAGGLIGVGMWLFGTAPDLPDVLRPTWVVSRPLDLIGLFLGAVAFAVVLPAWHRRWPTPLSHGVLLAALPATAAHLVAAFGWVGPWDLHGQIAHLLALLAAVVLAGSTLLDAASAHRSRLAALERIASTEVELSRRTAALEKVDRDLLAEAAQRRRVEDRFRSLLENASDLIWSSDADGRLLFLNRAGRRRLGYSEEAIRGLGLADLLVDAASVERRRLQDPSQTIEMELRTREGERVVVEGGFARASDGGAGEMLAIVRDVTERHRLARSKEEFVSVVSHELRTPLTSLIAALSMLRDGGLDAEDSVEMLEISARNGERLLRLIDDLLDLQKLASGHLVVGRETVLLEEVVRESCERIGTLAVGKGVRLEVDGDARLEVRGDRHRLAQVVDNLLSNAIKFSPAGTDVRVAWEREGGNVVLRVRDRGPGIPSDYRDRVFEAFSQADGSSTRRVGGTGLGLAIVRRLVEAMEGKVDFTTSVEPATSGTEFRIRLRASGVASGPAADV